MLGLGAALPLTCPRCMAQAGDEAQDGCYDINERLQKGGEEGAELELLTCITCRQCADDVVQETGSREMHA